jgi:biopolymer transport protein ExbD
MRMRRTNKLLIEPPASATGDIAFNLIVFFLVCASVQPDAGRKQTIPSSETVQDQKQEETNVEVLLTRDTVALDGDFVAMGQFLPRLQAKLAGKTSPDDRVVVFKEKPDTPYSRYINVMRLIDEAGGVIVFQIEEEREVMIP